jgi:hypothetical protein
MKRCPRCDFIYDDDQRLCDLDGAELVHASGALPPPEISAPRPAAPPVKGRRRGFAVLPIAGVVLAAALFSVYYSLPHRAAPQDTEQPPTKLTAPAQPEPNFVLAPTPAADTPSPAPPAATSVRAVRRAAPTPKRPPENSRPSLPKQDENQAETERTSRRKESKLSSVLKKTGRFLKKPFKF